MEAISTIKNSIGWQFKHSYTQLPEPLFARVIPTPVKRPKAVLVNYALAEVLGLKFLKSELAEIAETLSGNEVPPGADPIAQAYMGHQFGYPNMLGDGRAILLGEQITPTGKRFDIQLKGPGITKYSRSGDGRATLSAMLREYIISEAMHHLGIPTTRSLAVIATGEPVYRETIQEGAVLTRVAASHIRVGTFEFAARHLPKKEFRIFLNYVIKRHYQELQESANPALDLLQAVMERQADLICQWMRVGFIHGVMNTDNMSISGETIDYGPCAFMNRYDPATVFSSIDTGGRYAYGNQPYIAQWNLAVFASSLIPLLHDDETQAVEMAKSTIQTFQGMYAEKWLTMMRKKLGLINELTGDKKLADDLLLWMESNQADYTNTFYQLSSGIIPTDEIYHDDSFKLWYEQWKIRLLSNEQPEEVSLKTMRNANPAFIPRNHRVEEALQSATLGKDFSMVNQLLDVIGEPYNYRPLLAAFQQPPFTGEETYKTFCGT
jgi:uncharacterized protein YdiU (UPF0061 family)